MLAEVPTRHMIQSAPSFIEHRQVKKAEGRRKGFFSTVLDRKNIQQCKHKIIGFFFFAFFASSPAKYLIYLLFLLFPSFTCVE